VLAVVGDVDPAEAAAVLAREFGELAPRGAAGASRARRGPSTAVVREDRAPSGRRRSRCSSRGRRARDPERVAAQLLAGVASGLGGRFFDELRDRRSLAYTVHAFAPARRCAGAFGAYIATGPDAGGRGARGAARRVRAAARGGRHGRGAGAGADVRARHARHRPAERRRRARRRGRRVAPRRGARRAGDVRGARARRDHGRRAGAGRALLRPGARVEGVVRGTVAEAAAGRRRTRRHRM
jgi:hypothetical protein